MAAFDANIQQYPNSELERAGLYGKFLNELYNNKDTSQARVLFSVLSKRYPESAEAFVAEIQLDNYVTSSFSTSSIALQIGETSEQVAENSAMPVKYNLSQNYPNPFNPITTVNYDLPDEGYVTLKVYDILGREVMTLVDGDMVAGYHQVSMDGSALSSGVYFYRLVVIGESPINAGTFTDVKKLLLLK